MDYIKIKCAKCGKHLLTYTSPSRLYKSPVSTCPKCGSLYLDPRCHELAIEGIPKDMFDIKSFGALGVVGVYILYRGIHMLGLRQIGSPEEIQGALPYVLILMGAMLILGGCIEIVTILFGIKRKKYDKLMEESQARMLNPSYVMVLEDLGYIIGSNCDNRKYLDD